MAVVGGKADPARYIALAAALAVAMGLLLFLAGPLRLGFIADFFGKPVLLGYRSCAKSSGTSEMRTGRPSR